MSDEHRLIRSAKEAFDALRQTRADLAQAEATIAARDAKIERLRAVLERIETASRHWADYNAAPDAVHYAHESTARLARAAIKETEHD